jgi:hypothetical protein
MFFTHSPLLFLTILTELPTCNSFCYAAMQYVLLTPLQGLTIPVSLQWLALLAPETLQETEKVKRMGNLEMNV